MPDQRITGRPQLPPASRRQEVLPQVQARRSDGGLAPAAVDNNLSGLVQGLSQLNPALQGYFRQQEDAEQNHAAQEAAADAQRIANPQAALEGPMVAPENAPPAYANTYRQELARGLATRAASQIRTDTLDEYAKKRLDPDFDPEAWLAEKRQGALKGLNDPISAAIVGTHFTSLEEQISQDVRAVRSQRLQEVNSSAVAAYASETFTGNMSPQELAGAYPVFLEKAKGLGITAKEANVYMLNQLQHESNKLGGSPELFDVFDQPGSDGKALRFFNPELSQQIDHAKAQAKAARDKALEQAAEKGNAVTLMAYEEDIDKAPERVTPERILSDMTPHGAIPTAEKAASLWEKAQTALAKKQEQRLAEGLFDKGELWRVDAKVQDKVLTQRLSPAIELLAQATSTNKPELAAQVGHQIMQVQSRSGSTVPSDQLARYIKTQVSNLPSPEGASAAFQSAAALYKAMSANPAYRGLYFDEQTSNILDTYNSSTANGTDPKAAYVQAYQSTSPEGKAAAEAFVKTPEFRKLVDNDSKKWAEGSSMWPQWLGGNGRPQNVTAISAAVTGEMRAWRTRNPFATDEQAEAYAKDWTQKHFVLDTTSRTAVMVPPGLSGQAAQEALTENSKREAERLQLTDRSDAKWSIQYIPQGTEGHYTVTAWNGAAQKFIRTVSLQGLIEEQRRAKLLSPDELAKVGQLRQAFKSGQLIDMDPQLVAKASSLGAINPEQLDAYKAKQRKQFLDRVQSVPSLTFGKPTFDNLQFIPGKGPLVDNQLTSSTALEFAKSASQFELNPAFYRDSMHNHLAASLVTMGEGVMLNRYDDPANGAGKNIGMGYNLDANKANVESDLGRAGVPKERIQDVIQGRASLTPDQAKRLLFVALPRYEKQVKDVAESTSAGLWDRMAPTQKAAMIDVAWQVGDPAQFKKAWAALAAGDQKAFAEETKVTYVNQAGARVEDTRRNNLRASMLAGTAQWEAAVQKFGTLPSNKLQASMLRNAAQ